MPKNETLTTRVTRLENAMVRMAETMNTVGEKIDTLIEAQLTTELRFQQTDERIGKLVSAIGELISRIPPQSLR